MADNVIFNSKVSVEQLAVNGEYINNIYATKKELEEITVTGGDGNTKYTLSKSGSIITLTGTDGSTSSVSDTDTHIDVIDSFNSADTTRPASANATRIAYETASSAVDLANAAQATADSAVDLANSKLNTAAVSGETYVGDLNSAPIGISWIACENCSNSPISSGFGYLEVWGGMQRFTHYITGEVYYRSYVNSAWGSWKKIETGYADRAGELTETLPTDKLPVVPISKGGTGATDLTGITKLLCDGQPNTTPEYVIGLNSSYQGNGYTSIQQLRNTMGLGNTTGALPVANGGTGATTADDAIANLGGVKKTGDTIIGTLQVNGPIFGYNYTNANGNNLAAFVFDKPGADLTGIGSHGESDTIYFGAVSDRDIGAWDDSYKQKWKFNGDVIADTVVSGSIYPSSTYAANIFPGDEGWYRIYTSDDYITDSTGRTSCSFTIGRNYYSPQNEQYDFSVSVGYSGDINITQLSGVQGGYLITKIRVVHSPSSKFYIDFYAKANASEYSNTYCVYNCSGIGQFQSPAFVESIPDGYRTHEFETVAGCKSDRGFTGDLRGNAATASVASIARAVCLNGNPNSPTTFNWSGRDGQPEWLWGGSNADVSNMYVYDARQFSVNYANSAGTIDGFTRTTSCTWGNQTGTGMMELATASGGWNLVQRQ